MVRRSPQASGLNVTYKYEMLDGAKDDYEGIVEHLIALSDGPSAARSFADEFDRQIDLVCDNPDLYGLSRMPELKALGYHAVLASGCLALYFFRDDTVFVAHIFHQLQDYARFVTEPDFRS